MIVSKVLNPVILTLVMVDHHFADEDYSGDDHRSYDDDHCHSGDEDHVGVDAPVAHCGPV